MTEVLIDHATGKPLVAYHGTPFEFTQFDDGVNGGIHFGTLSQASHVLSLKTAKLSLAEFEALPQLEGGQPGRIIAANLAIKNPKRVKDARTAEMWQFEIERAKAEGYDGLVYQNDFEGRDERDSWVVFSSSQVHRLDEPAMEDENEDHFSCSP